MTLEINVTDIPGVVTKHIIPGIEKFKIFTFQGTLGSGKTTLIKEILLQCGVVEPVTSPTFAYVNTYTNSSGRKFHHFDLYRMETVASFIEAGFNELLHEKNTWCFIEWPECIEALLKNEFDKKNLCVLQLSYKEESSNQRYLKIEP